MHLNKYKKILQDAIDGADSRVTLQNSNAHQTIVLERMFANGNEIIRVLNDKFDTLVFGDKDLIESVINFAGDRSRTVKIALESLDAYLIDFHPFLRALKHHPNIVFRLIPKRISGSFDVNFSTIDDFGYRYVPDKYKTHAMVQFGDKEFTEKLVKMFDRIWALSNPVDK